MTMDREKEVLERILGICESKGYSQSELARHLGGKERKRLSERVEKDQF